MIQTGDAQSDRQTNRRDMNMCDTESWETDRYQSAAHVWSCRQTPCAAWRAMTLFYDMIMWQEMNQDKLLNGAGNKSYLWHCERVLMLEPIRRQNQVFRIVQSNDSLIRLPLSPVRSMWSLVTDSAKPDHMTLDYIVTYMHTIWDLQVSRGWTWFLISWWEIISDPFSGSVCRWFWKSLKEPSRSVTAETTDTWRTRSGLLY